jgi:hypothetical protein
MRRLWGRGRAVRYIFIHPTCGHADVEAGYLPEWGRPKFLCRRCGVAFDEAAVRLGWQGEQGAGEPPGTGSAAGPGNTPRS